jgi:hypothetical protein
VGTHAQQQCLVRLACAVDANVGQRGGRQHAAHRVERLGLEGLPVDEVTVRRILGEAVAEELGHRRRQLGVGVEQAVEVAHVAQAQVAREHLRVAVVAVAATDAGVVGDVPSRLLEVRHQAAALEDLRQEVGGLLARQVHTPELGHRVVAVLQEHPVVQLLGALQADGSVDRSIPGDVEVAHELVEEQPAQALGRTGVPGEQGPLHDLRQVDQGKRGPVEVGEVPPQDVGLGGSELLADVGSHKRLSG